MRTDRREEQGFRSLLKWAAKGAHLLRVECLLEPGDRLMLHAPAGWVSAAVCYAAWWVGLIITVDGDAHVAVHHEALPPPEGADTLFVLGDAPDGSPLGDTPSEAWAAAIQAFPDQPPEPAAARDRSAVMAGDLSWTHAELLQAARQWGDEGALGVLVDAEPAVWLAAVVRPLVTGAATVVLAGADPAATRAEGVTRWAS
ncbi:MAG TPA: hypothetical protein VHF25_09990 [Nitriliruptorales bacterium]|nr:hypothetical protein [Nitriliruptorales bacterium]